MTSILCAKRGHFKYDEGLDAQAEERPRTSAVPRPVIQPVHQQPILDLFAASLNSIVPKVSNVPAATGASMPRDFGSLELDFRVLELQFVSWVQGCNLGVQFSAQGYQGGL